MKISFEKAVIITIILIVLVSSYTIYSQYIDILNLKISDSQETSANKTSIDLRFYTSTIIPDKYYSQRDFSNAKDDYLKLAFSDITNMQQKSYIMFKLGMCYYYLEDYEKAISALQKSIDYEPDNANVYNNIAVIYQKMGKVKNALEYENRALEILPVIEYRYNLAKIYEHNGEYSNALKQFYIVSKGIFNLTLVDPVKVQNRMYNLLGNKDLKSFDDDNPVIALRLKNPLDVPIIDEGEMELKNINFDIKLNGMDEKEVVCKFDKEAVDPYNLIKATEWKIDSNNKTIYKSTRSTISFPVEVGRVYNINLTIKYKGNKTKERNTQILITSTGYKTNFKSSEIVRIEDQKCKWYDYAIYEQVFEPNFNITTKGFYDRFNVIWRKNQNITLELMEKDIMDTGGALYIVNKSNSPGGIEANLTSLLNDKKLKGKKISIKFNARKITNKENLTAVVRVDNKPHIFDDFDLIYRWKQFNMTVNIPENCKGLTFALSIKEDEEIKIDGFIITVLD